jgi:hypothetical protein
MKLQYYPETDSPAPSIPCLSLDSIGLFLPALYSLNYATPTVSPSLAERVVATKEAYKQ